MPFDVANDAPGQQGQKEERTLHSFFRPSRWGQVISYSSKFDWDAFGARLASHPHEASVQCEEHGRYPLHYVVSQTNPPPALAIVRALCDAHPAAIHHVDEAMGYTALHKAAQLITQDPSRGGLGLDVGLFLLRRHPGAAFVRSKIGCPPIYYAENIELIKALANEHPKGLGEADNTEKKTKLYRAVCYNPDLVPLLVQEGWKHQIGGPRGGGGVFLDPIECFGMKGKSPVSRVIYNWLRHLKGETSLHLQSADYEGAVESILRAAHSAIEGYDDIASDPLLCCAVSVGRDACPEGFVSALIAEKPGEATARDRQGRNPLHIAASRPKTELRTFKDLLRSEGGIEATRMLDGSGGALGLGRLPLHVAAAEGGRRKAARMIAEVEPRASSTMDATTKMYPFMMAAIGQKSSVDAVFALLRQAPFLLVNYIPLDE